MSGIPWLFASAKGISQTAIEFLKQTLWRQDRSIDSCQASAIVLDGQVSLRNPELRTRERRIDDRVKGKCVLSGFVIWPNAGSV
jgi:hypothetical protein